jgi:hypothetical protein
MGLARPDFCALSHLTELSLSPLSGLAGAGGVPVAAAGPSACGGPGVDIGAGGWPAFIGHELRCGGYRVAGRQRVDGMDAIEVTGGRGSMRCG